MRTPLLGVLLLTSTVCNAQAARTSEGTNATWNFMDLSVETWDARKWTIAGTTEPNAAGQTGPLFKFTTDFLVPQLPAPLPTYRYTYGTTQRVLMDFTVDQTAGHVIMTGMEDVGGVAANRMFITRFNAPNGAIIFSRDFSIPGFNLIPHQIIYSTTNNQYVVVGTKYSGTMTSANFTMLPKTGFALIIDATTLATVAFIETNTPSTSTSDHDMLETVTERPGAGVGYFAGGSANGFGAGIAEQNMMVMNFSAAGAPGASCVVDNTTSRSAVSSVIFNPALGQIVSLNNSSSNATYELLRFNAATCAPTFPAVRHILNSCLPTGARPYGCRLQQASGGNQIIIGGNATVPTSAVLVPFQTTTNPGLGAMINAKTFQTNNTSPLTGYFNEGAGLYINTPDMMVYNGDPAVNKTYLVNPNTGVGFDMLRSIHTGTLACEAGCQFTAASASYATSTVSFAVSTPLVSVIDPILAIHTPANTVLCSSVPLAPINDDIQEATDSPFKLFPNPATDKLEISSDNVVEEAIIYDLNGNRVLAATNEQHAGIRIIDISMLKAGAYIITLKDSEGILQRAKFVKE